jgi:hypothetical protein
VTARYHSTRRDAWNHPGKQTPWQKERERGVIHPMLSARDAHATRDGMFVALGLIAILLLISLVMLGTFS